MLARSAALLALALATAFAAASAAATPPSPPAPPNGFAGPVARAPRPIDRDVEGRSGTALHEISCAGGGDRRCWIAR